MNSKLILTTLLLSVSIGCNEPTAANESNLRHGLNQYLEARRNCWMFTEAGGKPPVANGSGPMLDLLVKDNLLKQKQETQSSGSPATAYELTDKGLRTKTMFVNVNMDEMDGYLCSGKLIVDRVLNFTQPSDENGTRSTKVFFTTKLDDVPAWAKDAAFTAINPSFEPRATRAGEKLEQKLVLTNHGWLADRDL
jgi:hypothetical protein